MNSTVAIFLTQDGLTNGAIYALLAQATVLVFAVTRILFVPQGDFVTLGALTFASLQAGRVPPSVWLLLGLGGATVLVELWRDMRARRLRQRFARTALLNLGVPLAVAGGALLLAPLGLPLFAQIAVTFAIIVPLGPMLYRLAFQPFQDASILVLLIVAVAVHLALQGLVLAFFGAEGFRAERFTDVQWGIGEALVSAESVLVLGVSILLMIALTVFFYGSVYGKALRATALNRIGARLMGIRPALAGSIAFGLSAALGALAGVLVAPMTTLYFDSGFLMGLKGFVAAVIGGLASYPLAAFGAIFVGVLEAFSAFWASSLKEVIVFASLIPILLWRSLRGHKSVGDDES